MQIQDSVAIVSGGNRGIGQGFVRGLLAAGARKVYVGARDPKSARHLEREFPGRAIAITLDVTDRVAVEAAALECDDVSIVINNAGAFHNQLLIGAQDILAARNEMDVNYFGPLLMSRAFASILARSESSAILNVLSVGAILAVPNMGGYSPSKFAAHALTTILRAELSGQGTHVGCLIVGSVDTRMAQHVAGEKERPEDIAKAGIAAIKNKICEMDTDMFALKMRAALHRDPAALEQRMAASVFSSELSTGR